MIPAYHLRINKAVDRHIFLELLKLSIGQSDMKKYAYYTLGGPFLDDIKMISSAFPKMKLVSIEADEQVYLRQKFHKPTRNCKLYHCELNEFVSNFDGGILKSVFWLDFTNFRACNIDLFVELLPKLKTGSIIKVTLPSDTKSFYNEPKNKQDDGSYKPDKEAKFNEWFDNYLENKPVKVQLGAKEFSKTILNILKVAAIKALPKTAHSTWLMPLSTSYYKDGAPIFTFTGIITNDEEKKCEVQKYKSFGHFSNLWDQEIKEIKVPFLSNKEVLWLQPILPSKSRNLIKFLGYEIEGGDSKQLMNSYKDLHMVYPSFVKTSL